jgi:hypothetical protein
MSVNKSRPHVFVLPEDDANSELANGSHLEINSIRQFQVLPVAGGWMPALRQLRSDHIREMEDCQHRILILLIDFDGKEGRREQVTAEIPTHLNDRIFVLGTWTKPERLTSDLRRSCEEIGGAIARDCRDNTNETWGHVLLRHNANEVERLRPRVREVLFI